MGTIRLSVHSLSMCTLNPQVHSPYMVMSGRDLNHISSVRHKGGFFGYVLTPIQCLHHKVKLSSFCKESAAELETLIRLS